MRKKTRILLSLLLSPVLLTTSLGVMPANAGAAAPGDINQSSTVDASDALLALQHSVKLTTLSGEQFACADVDASDTVDASDALLILQHSVKLIDRFPCEVKTTGTNPWTGEKVYTQYKGEYDYEGIITTFQEAANYGPELDVPSDSVMLYAGTVNSSDTLMQSWVNNNVGNRTIDIMISANRPLNQAEYVNQFGGNFDYELQRLSTGERVDPNNFAYIVPTENFINYNWAIIKHHCEMYPVRMVVFEEPEIWRNCGYSDAFKDEWKAYYGEEWQDPNSSAEARYKSSKLGVYLCERFLSTLTERTKEAFPEVKMIVATHSVAGYADAAFAGGSGVSAGVSRYANIEGIDGIIGQTWSNTVGVPISYNGSRVTRRFESGYIDYASYVDVVDDAQLLFTLSDPYADGGTNAWDYYVDTYKKTMTAQLLQQDVFRFQESIWLNRSFSADVPSDYRTMQLNVFNALPLFAGKESTLYAGTPGISVGISDSMSWQCGINYMSTESALNGFYGLTLPLVEKGLPITITSLDDVKSKEDLDDIKVLVLSYDIMKPLNEEINKAIADWVKDGGVLLYAGGGDSYSTEVSGEWWSEMDTTPVANLFKHLGLDVTISTYDYMGMTEWKGASGYGSSFENSILMGDIFTNCYSGNGISPLLVCSDNMLGFEAKVGSGQVLAVGLPSSTYSAADGAQKMVDLVKYAVKYTDVSYVESNLMAIQRGDFIAAETLSEGETLTGNFIDIFDSKLPVLTEKVMQTDSSALLMDISYLLESDIPRFAHTGGHLQGEIVETADKTTYSLYGPKSTTTSTRLLGNGKYPQSVLVTDKNGEAFAGDVITLWDNETSSLLVQISHTSTDVLTVEVHWGDAPVETTPEYTVGTLKVQTNESDQDAEFLFENNATASKAFRQCQYDESLTYKIDLEKYDNAYAILKIFYNYVVEVSNDNQNWTTVYDYRDISSEYTEKNTNRIDATVFSPDKNAEAMYIRLSNTDPSKEYGAGIFSLTVKYHQPISEE